MEANNPYDVHNTFAELGVEIDLFLSGGGSIRHVEDCNKKPPTMEEFPDQRMNRQMCLFAIDRYTELRKADDLMPAAPSESEADRPLFVLAEIARYCKMAPIGQ